MMQKFLLKINSETISLIIEILSKSLEKIIINIYGNYFCQKLIICCNINQRMELLKCVRNII
jgi:hypothetical protein